MHDDKNVLFFSRPHDRGNKFSILGAISGHFVQHHLIAQMRPEEFLVMDNVSFHKIKFAQELLQKAGVEVVYLPPYSPELSPIEYMRSKTKNILRKYAARTVGSFQEAIRHAFMSI